MSIEVFIAFKFARLQLARSIDQFKMLIIDKMNQYVYAREGENWLMADSHPPSRRNTDSFLQGHGFVELIDRVLKIEM